MISIFLRYKAIVPRPSRDVFLLSSLDLMEMGEADYKITSSEVTFVRKSIFVLSLKFKIDLNLVLNFDLRSRKKKLGIQ